MFEKSSVFCSLAATGVLLTSSACAEFVHADRFEDEPTVVLLGVPQGTVSPGQSFTIRWGASNTQLGNNAPCTRSGSATEWAPGGFPLSNQPAVNNVGVTVTVPPQANNGEQIQFSLSCLGNQGVSQVVSQNVTVGGIDCTNATPAGIVQLGFPSAWPGNFRSSAGFNVGNAPSLSQGECVALAFNAGEFGVPPRWTAGALQIFTSTNGNQGAMSLSISRCPCDFRSSQNTSSQTCLTLPSSKSSLGWRLLGSPADTPGVCPLLVNTNYFVNIAYGSSTQTGFGSCAGGDCRPIGNNICQQNCP
jgi:hypothetical protein